MSSSHTCIDLGTTAESDGDDFCHTIESRHQFARPFFNGSENLISYQ
jgi:hypothetical protein